MRVVQGHYEFVGWYHETVRLEGGKEVFCVRCSRGGWEGGSRLSLFFYTKKLCFPLPRRAISPRAQHWKPEPPLALHPLRRCAFTRALVMPNTERSPLLPTSSKASGKSPAPSSSTRTTTRAVGASSPASSQSSTSVPFFTEDDIAIEGMVLVLLQELDDRGYTIPAGLVDSPLDMPPEEADAERSVLRTVFGVPRHRLVLNEYLPYLERATVEQNGGAGGAGVGGGASGGGRAGAGSGSATAGAVASATPYSSTRPSPLSSQVLDSTVLTSPSALLLAALLSLLISLQADVTSNVQETDRGVDGELRMFKARRELGERLYAVVGGLLDSYLLSGDQREEEGEDALVTLLFHDFALNYDSMDRATCCESALALFGPLFGFSADRLYRSPRPPPQPILLPTRRG